MAARFTHLALPCRDLDATIAWYEAHTPMRAFHRRSDLDAEVDAAAEVGRSSGCLHWEPERHPPPVGYLCALTDPDGNVVEFSYGQGL